MRHLFRLWPIFILLLAGCQSQPSLKPIRPTPTPGGGPISGVEVMVTFTELESDPFRYLNRVIQVSGEYVRLPPPACRYERGPRVRWALIAEGFRMDATGFEPVLRLMPESFPMTVNGIWRRYEGRLGCGKGAPVGVAWYLEVQRIVHPNPLPLFDAVATIPPPAPPDQPETAPMPEATLPAEEVTPVLTPGIMTPTLTPSATPTLSAAPPGLPTATVPSLASPAATVTAVPTTTATPTATPAAATPPPLPATPTATPQTPGYPGPPPPPPPALTPSPYP
jgi:hypothetical protein